MFATLAYRRDSRLRPNQIVPGWVTALTDEPAGGSIMPMQQMEERDSGSNVAEYSVSEISFALKRKVEDTFGHVRVRGEISGYRGRHSSGHAYFALKDDRARLEAVIWKGTFARLRFLPEEGMEVVATGRLTTYPGSSKYQIVIDSIEPAGAGALMALLEERKKRLAAEGLFEESRKRALPFMPRVIGVVTSPTGAVIRDIIHRITDRFPVHVLVWPVRVQGETCGAEVTAAVTGFNALDGDPTLPRPDVIIVARGGGSLEDLWGFNDEALARAVAASAIPVISAVGHETDWTLVDFVADRRAPTPTGAAEMAVPVRADLEAAVARLSARLKSCATRGMDRRRQTLHALARALPSPDQILALPRRRFDEAGGRLSRALDASTQRKRLELSGVRLTAATLTHRLAEGRRRGDRCGDRLPVVFRNHVAHARNRFARDATRVAPSGLLRRMAGFRDRLDSAARGTDRCIDVRLQQRRTRLDHAGRLVESLSYKAILERGFALVRDGEDKPLKRVSDVKAGSALSIEFVDGRVQALAAGAGVASRPAPRKNPPKAPPPKQGSLF